MPTMRVRQVSELAENYPGTVVSTDAWRVIRCRQDWQWIIQRKPQPREGASTAATRKWDAVAYVYDGSRMKGVLSRPSLGAPKDQLDILLAGWKHGEA